MTPFDFVNAINFGKTIEMDDDTEQAYVPFIVNRQFSYFPDTILVANQANMIHELDHAMQFAYLINNIKPRKRFSKWAKKHEDSDVELVMEHYKYNREDALNALSILTKPQLEDIKNKYNKGGI